MSKTILFSYIISIGGLSYAFMSAFLIEKKEDIADKKVGKFLRIIQKSISRFSNAINQLTLLLAVGLAIYFAGSNLGVKIAAVFIAGIFAAFFVGKIALKLLDASNKKSKNPETIAAVSAVVSVTAVSIAILTMALGYQIANDVKTIIPFIFGIFLVSAMFYSAGSVFLEAAKKAISENVKIISRTAVYVFAEPMEFLGNFLFAPVAAAILGLYLTGVNGRAVLLPIVLTLFAAALMIIELIVLRFLKRDKYKRFFQRYFWVFSAAMLVISFFVVKNLIGINKIFWAFALGIGLAAALKIFEGKTKSVLTQNIILAAIFIVIAWAFKINGAYAAAIAGLGATLSLSVSYIENACFNFLKNSSAEINFIEVNISEKKDLFGGEDPNRRSHVLSEISLISFVIMFLLFIKLFGINTLNLMAGRTIFGLFIGGLLAIFANFFINEMSKKSFEKSEKEMGSANLEDNYKKYIKIISGFSLKTSTMLFMAIAVAPIVVLWILGLHSFISVIVGMVVSGAALSFTAQESGHKNIEIIEMAKVLLLFVLILAPILI